MAALPEIRSTKPSDAAQGFAPEFQLVLACLHWPLRVGDREQIRCLTKRPIDWNWLVRIVNTHQVVPLVYSNLREVAPDAMPPEIASVLYERMMLDVRRSLVQATELARLVEQLEDASIRVTALKGVPLSILAYGSPAMRECHDLDLLIAPSDVSVAEGILARAGYVRTSPKAALTPRRFSYYMRYCKDFTYYSDKKDVTIELHWRLFKNALMPLQSDSNGPSASRLSFGSKSVSTLSRDDLLLYLCMHGAIHAWALLKWLADLGALLGTIADQDLSRAIERASSLGGDAEVGAALILLDRFLGIHRSSTKLPGETNSRVARIVRFSTEGLTRNGYCQGLRPGSEMFAYTFLLRPSWNYRMQCLIDNAVLPRDWELVDLPDALFPLYLGIRPFSWLIRRRVASAAQR